MRAKPDCEAQNAGIGTPTAGSPECGHWHAHSAKPRMRAHHRGCTAAESSEYELSLLLHHVQRALRDGTTSQSLRIGVKKINSTVLLEEPLKTPEKCRNNCWTRISLFAPAASFSSRLLRTLSKLRGKESRPYQCRLPCFTKQNADN